LLAVLWLPLFALITPVLAESPFPGQTFGYSNPPADVAALTVERTSSPRNRSDRPILVKGNPLIDPSEPSFIFFSTGNDCLDTEIYPVIAAFENGQWNTISFPGAARHIWSHVYRSYPDGERMYAISRSHCESGGPEIYIYRSSDAGRTWTVASIAIHYLSHFLSLRMEPDGSGEIIVQSDNDADPVGGHHVYRTSDWGDRWSEPVFSKTILAPPAQGGEYFSEYVPVPKLMDDIAGEYAKHRELR